jgi:TonB family protein
MRKLAFACACAIAALSALPAFGDIKSFNAAVTAGDFKKAAAEAATTWPTLDKSRKDIALIAREFGFVAYVAKDYAAAKTYAEFAAAQKADGADAAETQALSNVLLGAAKYRLKPSEAARDALFGALEARALLANFDNISFAASEAVVGHDLEKGRWRDAMASAGLAAKLASGGGPYYAYERRKYELYQSVADYRVREKADTYDRLSELIEAICAEASAVSSDKAAQRLIELFWETWAWRATLSAHLTSRGVGEHTRKKGQRDIDERARWERLAGNEQLRRRLGRPPMEYDPAACQKTFDIRTKPDFPGSALYRGFVGSVVLRADIDDNGKLQNPEILAAVPEKYFGGAVLKAFDGMRYLPGKVWDPTACKMAQAGKVITFEFVIPR